MSKIYMYVCIYIYIERERERERGHACKVVSWVKLIITKILKASHGFLFLFLFWLCCAACGISVPRSGIEPGPQQ